MLHLSQLSMTENDYAIYGQIIFRVSLPGEEEDKDNVTLLQGHGTASQTPRDPRPSSAFPPPALISDFLWDLCVTQLPPAIPSSWFQVLRDERSLRTWTKSDDSRWPTLWLSELIPGLSEANPTVSTGNIVCSGFPRSGCMCQMWTRGSSLCV